VNLVLKKENKMGLFDDILDEINPFKKKFKIHGQFPDRPIIPGDPAENIKDALDPLKIMKRKIFGVSPNEAENKFSKGDHLYTQRTGYTHHGIYIGNGNVIHYLQDGILLDSLSTFSNGYNIDIKNSSKKYKRETIVERAYSRIGENSYNVIWKNCEQFSLWCRNGS